MTGVSEFFCNFCNPGAQRRDAGDEVNTGYARVQLGVELPHGWERAEYDGVPGAHRCPTCVEDGRPDPRPTPKLSGVNPGGWPSHLSPFGPDGG